MKTSSILLILSLTLSLCYSCKKEEPAEIPVLTTAPVSNLTAVTATGGGIIDSDGGAPVTSRGVCWGISEDPVISASMTTDGEGTGSFVSYITGLSGGTSYHVRAYATNSVGTAYGEDLAFTALGQAPSAVTLAATNLTTTGATLNGTVVANDIPTTVTFEYGTSTDYGQTATATPGQVTGNATANVGADLSGLTQGTAYHFRIKAVNALGTTYGNDIVFTTLGSVPAVTTSAATGITVSGATLNGSANANELVTTVTFEYGTTAGYGLSVSATPGEVTGNSNTNAVADLTGLTPGTTYHFRIKAVNSLGTTYGSDIVFTTLGSAPAVTTSAATNITVNEATLNGSANANELETTVTFEYGTTVGYGQTVTATPGMISGNTITNAVADITGLNPGATYHFRIKAVNSLGITYGNDNIFITLGSVPAAATSAATNLSVSGATLNGSANANELETTVTFEYGTTTVYGQTVTAAPGQVTGNTNTNVVGSLTGLNPGTVYHFRIKAVNSLGTTYGSDIVFTTSGSAPAATSSAATNLSANGATLNGSVNAHEVATTVTFEYGSTTVYGQTVSATPGQVTGNTATNVSAVLSGLTQGITYHFRVKAVNSLGTTYGGDIIFVTTSVLPSATTLAAISINSDRATLSGIANANGSNTTVIFEYGLTTSYGQTASPVFDEIDGTSNITEYAAITGLTLGLTYHFRIKAVNSSGTAYGSDMSFTTSVPTQVTDINGNVYNVIAIGSQSWLKESMKATKYNDGTDIPNVIDNTQWSTNSTGAYCDYNNTSANSNLYGRLYNWYVAGSTNPKNVCPVGWHVATDADWTALSTFLGGESVAGGKLKETGTSRWATPNTGATNETGFTALPGGYRSQTGSFGLRGTYGFWWTATEGNATFAYYRYMFNTSASLDNGDNDKRNGSSVRCVKN